MKIKFLEGIKFNIFNLLGTKVLQFVTGLVLARLLLPEVFGQYQYAMTAIGFYIIVFSQNFSPVIIQSKTDLKKLLDTTFTVQILLNLAQLLLIFITIGPAAKFFFKNPDITVFVRIMSLVLFLKSFGIVESVFLKNMQFQVSFWVSIAEQVVISAVSIILALLGFGVYSLIISSLMGVIINLAVLYSIIPVFPFFRLDRAVLRELFHFSWPLYLLSFSVWIYWNLDDFFVGRWFGLEQLGYYHRAFWLPQNAVLLKDVIGSALFVTFSSIKQDGGELKRRFDRITEYTALLLLPFTAVFIPYARQTILLLYGSRWEACIFPFKIFVFIAVFRAVYGNWSDLYMSEGKTKPLLIAHLPNSIGIAILGFLVVKLTDTGINGMAVATALPMFLTVPLSVLFIKKKFPFSPIGVIRPALIASSIVFAANLIISRFVSGLPVYLLCAGGSFAAYFVLLLVLKPGYKQEFPAIIRGVLNRPS